MKKKLLGLFCACLLLSSCQSDSWKSRRTTPPATENAPDILAIVSVGQKNNQFHRFTSYSKNGSQKDK
jgi:hypothetical protein